MSIDDDNEFLAGPRWRTRTTPARRARFAVATFAAIAAVGGGVLVGIRWLLDSVGAPSWVFVALWLVPTLLVVGASGFHPRPAIANDDDETGWAAFAIRYSLVGEGEPRPVPLRIITASLFGAPVTWSLLVFGLSTLVGVFDV